MYVHDLLQAVADTRARRAVGMGFDLKIFAAITSMHQSHPRSIRLGK